MTGVQFLSGAEKEFFSFHHHVQTSSGAHPASYLMVTRVKAARRVKVMTYLHVVSMLRMLGAIHPLPHISSWHRA
jgi:hypothetical protein